MDAAIGEMVRAIHEQHGVRFHLGTTVVAITEHSVTLSAGQQLDADVVVIGTVSAIPRPAPRHNGRNRARCR